MTQRVKKDLPYSMRPVTEEKGHDAIGTRPVELHHGEVTQGKTLVLGTPYFIYQGSELGPARWVFYVFQRFYPLMAIEIYYNVGVLFINPPPPRRFFFFFWLFFFWVAIVISEMILCSSAIAGSICG